MKSIMRVSEKIAVLVTSRVLSYLIISKIKNKKKQNTTKKEPAFDSLNKK